MKPTSLIARRPLATASAAFLGLLASAADGRQCIEWQQVQTQNTPSRPVASLVYDKARHETLAIVDPIPSTGRMEVFRLNGQTWSHVPVGGAAPADRGGPGVVFHEGRQTVVLFGGATGSEAYNDLWEWNGAGWIQIVHAAPWPPALYPMHMVYDPNRSRLIVVQKQTGPGEIWRTWEWTGTVWEPGALFDTVGGVEAMCFDTARNRGFIYSTWPDWSAQTFEYTPGAPGLWQHIPVLGTPFIARYEPALEYDPYRRQIIMHGGREVISIYHYSKRTLAWDPVGTQWVELALMPKGQERNGSGICFNSDLGQMILYGGTKLDPPPTGYTYFFDTWELHREDPGIVVDPPPAALWCAGGSHVLSITMAGSGNVQWYRNGQPIPGATSTILLVNPATTAHAGAYRCEVWNNCGGVFSNPCVVTVAATPSIQQPFNYTPNVCPGAEIVFVQALPAPATQATLVLQKKFGEFWQTVSAPYVPAEQAFIIANAQNADTGWYRLAASNVCTSAVSSEVHVQVGVTFSAQPQSLSEAACSQPQFAVTAAGVGSLLYQWHKDGVPLVDDGHMMGVHTATLTINGTRYDDEGSYHCVVTDTCESRATAAASLALPTPGWVHSTTSGPPYRSVQASDMAYDPVRGVSVLYGGYGYVGYLDDTWEWDGITWTQKFPPTNPGKRSGQELAFDPVRGTILLFGGFGNVLPNSEVWSWDGTDWTLITTSPGGPPVNEASHGDIAFDAARGKMVLVCEGQPSSPIPMNVTWEFDSATATWQQVYEGFGPSHFSSPIAFDANLEQTVGHYYGLTTAPTEARTWLKGAAGWVDSGLTTPPRYWPVMAWDALRERTTIYGCCRGTGPGSYTTDTHAFDGNQWSFVLPSFHATQESAVVPLTIAFDTKRRAMVMVGSSYDDYWAGLPQQNGKIQTWEYRYLDRVVIDRQPVDQPLNPGQNAQFVIHAAGIGTLAYQWRKGGTPLTNGPTPAGSVVSGAQSATLTISGVTGSDVGAYTCQVSNACGAVISSPAMLGSPCYPDCNGSGTLTVADFGCFQTKFVAGDPYADCNSTGGLTIADFGCFQTSFVAGCP